MVQHYWIATQQYQYYCYLLELLLLSFTLWMFWIFILSMWGLISVSILLLLLPVACSLGQKDRWPELVGGVGCPTTFNLKSSIGRCVFEFYYNTCFKYCQRTRDGVIWLSTGARWVHTEAYGSCFHCRCDSTLTKWKFGRRGAKTPGMICDTNVYIYKLYVHIHLYIYIYISGIIYLYMQQPFSTVCVPRLFGAFKNM